MIYSFSLLAVLLITISSFILPTYSFTTSPSLSFVSSPRSTTHLHSTSSSTKTHQPPSALILMDHGSTRTTSNSRLQTLSSKLENLLTVPPRPLSPNECPRVNFDNNFNVVAVRHCHMEIAEPSLLESCRALYDLNTNIGGVDGVKKGVERIFIHPFFLSPSGKHITVDIPLLVDEVREDAKKVGWNGEFVITGVVGEEEETMFRGVMGMVGRGVRDEEKKKEAFKWNNREGL